MGNGLGGINDAPVAVPLTEDGARFEETASQLSEAGSRGVQNGSANRFGAPSVQHLPPVPVERGQLSEYATMPLPPNLVAAQDLLEGARIGWRTHRIAGSDDPAMVDALQRGVHGASNTGQIDTANLRLIKIVQLGATQTAKIYEQYPGGPAMVEMSYAAQGNIGWKSGQTIEKNIGKTHRALPNDDRTVTTTFGEAIFRTWQFGLERRREYSFLGGNGLSGRQEAEQFLAAFEQNKAQQFSPVQLLPDSLVQSRIDAAYQQYRLDKGLPPGPEAGGEYVLHASPFAGKIYGSAGLDGLAPELSRFGVTVPPRASWVTDALLYGVGGYGEAALNTEISAKYTWDNKDIQQITVQTEDLDPGAPGAIILQGRLDYRLFGALSLGYRPVASGLAEGTHIGGGGVILDDYSWPVQSIISYEGHFNQLTPGADQIFRDVRVNYMPRLYSGQAQYSDLSLTRTAAKFEIRENLNPWTTPRDFLVSNFESQLTHAGPHRRFEEINQEMGSASPFTTDWETSAREAYERDVAGEPVSEEKWKSVLHDALTDRWYENVTESRPFRGAALRWETDFFTPEHKAAYARWDSIAPRLLQERTSEIKDMSWPQLYKAYADEGLRYPGVYIGIHQGSEEERAYAVGFGKGGPPAVDHAMRNLQGLAKATYRSEENNYRQVGSLAIAHEAYEHAEQILQDPLAAAGFVTLMNRSAYPRNDFNGQYMELGPAARLMYHGHTPTREIDRLLADTGLREQGHADELAKTPGVYKVQQEKTFAEIGMQALEGLTGRAVTAQEGAEYGERIRHLNFPSMTGQAAFAEHLFDGALIILPSPPQAQTP